jgi:hypothetical protein
MKNTSLQAAIFTCLALAVALLASVGCAQQQAPQSEAPTLQSSASTPGTIPDFAFVSRLRSLPKQNRQAFIQQNPAQVAQLSRDNNQTLQIEYKYLASGR